MRKIIAPALLLTLGLLSLPLAIVSTLYLNQSADVGAQGALAGQFDIPSSGLVPGSIAAIVLGAAWLTYAVPRYVKIDDSAPVDAVDEEEVLARAAAAETMAVDVVAGPAEDVFVGGGEAALRRRA